MCTVANLEHRMNKSAPCYRINPDDFSWLDNPFRKAKRLFDSNKVELREIELTAGALWSQEGPCFLLITNGQLQMLSGETVQVDDILWSKSSETVVTAGSKGVRFYLVQPKDDIGNEVDSAILKKASIAWQNFDDPAGRPTQPVQVLLDGSFSALRTRFVPSYIAGEHWHDFDTLYFICDGRMRFGDEGWFETGEIRAVHGGHSYGPEEPGDNSVEFVLISLGGPVALHWSDLEPPP